MMEEKTIRIAGKEIRIHELTTEEESEVRAKSQTWDAKKKTLSTDQPKLDALMIYYSVVRETWPKEWGPLSVETIRKLPSKLTRRLLFECQQINVLQEDVDSFLDSQQPSQTQTNTAQITS